MAPHTILEETSPNGNIEAFVEQDDRVAYLYLRGVPEIDFGVRSCWVRNLDAAPAVLDVEGMRNGSPPMLPREHCAEALGGPPLDSSRLRIVWFEEGDAAALLEGEEILAIVPSWSGHGGFAGYARDCISESPLCWPLPKAGDLRRRIMAAAEYWSAWDADDNPWTQVQKAQIAAYEGYLGPYEKYYGIDGGAWPPRALLRTLVRGGLSLTTVGICLRPQPLVEMATDTPGESRRIELAAGLASSEISRFESLARYISGQATLPWSAYSWLGHGHTIPCDAFPGTGFSAVILLSELGSSPRVSLPDFRGDRVRVLWLVPLTASELDFAMVRGSRELAERLEGAGVSWLWQPRDPVV